jgi:hypothetical protein
MSDINLPEYDDETMNAIWRDRHADFEAVGPYEMEDPTRWGYTASKTVRHVASGTFWMLTADISCGDQGETAVDEDLTRVYPREVTVTKYLPADAK